MVEVTLTNEGGAATGDIKVLLPDAPWLSLASPTTIESLAPGESTTATVLLSPGADLDLLAYKGNLFFDAPGAGTDLSLPFDFQATSEAVGSLRVNTVDELFYFADGAPRLSDATIRIIDPFSGEVVATAVTGEDGSALFEGLAEGHYTLEIKANDHDSFKRSITIKPGQNDDIESFLSRQTVKYVWSVQQTEIEDRTKITVESIFDTDIPIPVVTIDPPIIDLAELDVIGEVMQIDMTVTNHGLIATNDITLQFEDHPFFKIEPLIGNVDTLAANSTLTIPVRVTRISDFGTASTSSALGLSSTELTPSSTSVPCEIKGGLIWSYICGPNGVQKYTAIGGNNAGGNCSPGSGLSFPRFNGPLDNSNGNNEEEANPNQNNQNTEDNSGNGNKTSVWSSTPISYENSFCSDTSAGTGGSGNGSENNGGSGANGESNGNSDGGVGQDANKDCFPLLSAFAYTIDASEYFEPAVEIAETVLNNSFGKAVKIGKTEASLVKFNLEAEASASAELCCDNSDRPGFNFSAEATGSAEVILGPALTIDFGDFDLEFDNFPSGIQALAAKEIEFDGDISVGIFTSPEVSLNWFCHNWM